MLTERSKNGASDPNAVAPLQARRRCHHAHAKAVVQALSKLLFQALLEAGQEGGTATENNVVVQLALDVRFAAVHGVDDAVHNARVLLHAAQTKQLQLLFSKQAAVEQALGDSKPDIEEM